MRGNANLTPEGSDVRYDSVIGPGMEGGVSIDAPYLLFEGQFDATFLDDISNISDVGTGRVAVTCP